ncbi:MAG: DMT family transporter [Elainellaceae cyanobacterium]
MTPSSINPARLGVKQTPNLAFLLLFAALVSLAFTAIFIRISLQDISTNTTLFNRLWIATVIFGAWNGVSELCATDRESAADPKGATLTVILLLVAVAVVHVTGRFFMTWSLTQTTVAKATLLANLPPVFTMIGAWLFFKQQFDRRFIAGMAIALAGALVLSLSDLSLGHSPTGAAPILGDGAALLSSVFYAASCLMIEKLRTRLGAQNILFWRCLIGAGVMLPIVLATDSPILPTSWSSWGAVLCLAAVCEALGHGLVVYSLKYFSSTFVNVFLLLESILTAVFAYLIFSESLSPLNLLTFVMVLGGVFLAKASEDSAQALAAKQSG